MRDGEKTRLTPSFFRLLMHRTEQPDPELLAFEESIASPGSAANMKALKNEGEQEGE